MFKKPGHKIMIVGALLFILGIAGSIAGGVILLIDKLIWQGILTIVLGIIGSYILALIVYGLGDLIENTALINDNIYYIGNTIIKNEEEAKMNKEAKKDEDSSKKVTVTKRVYSTADIPTTDDPQVIALANKKEVTLTKDIYFENIDATAIKGMHVIVNRIVGSELEVTANISGTSIKFKRSKEYFE